MQGLRDLGYADGKNVVIDARFAETGKNEDLDRLAHELVRAGANVIVAPTNNEIAAAKRATSTTIPRSLLIAANRVIE